MEYYYNVLYYISYYIVTVGAGCRQVYGWTTSASDHEEYYYNIIYYIMIIYYNSWRGPQAGVRLDYVGVADVRHQAGPQPVAVEAVVTARVYNYMGWWWWLRRWRRWR